MTDAPASPVRPARRTPGHLSFEFEAWRLEDMAGADPDWLTADR
jgi:hypothetical protein